MPSLLGTDIAKNYEKFVINTSDAGREIVVQAAKTNMTDADLLEVYRQLTKAQGAVADALGNNQDGPDAFTFAGFGTADGSAFESGVTDVVFFRIQGTGTPDLDTVSGVALTKIAEFAPAR